MPFLGFGPHDDLDIHAKPGQKPDEPLLSVPADDLPGFFGPFITRDNGSGGVELAFVRPCRRKGVCEGRILGSLFLDVPGRSDTMSLNASGAAIWECCDGNRSLADINREFEARFRMSPGSLRDDIQAVIQRLQAIGAIRLEPG